MPCVWRRLYRPAVSRRQRHGNVHSHSFVPSRRRCLLRWCMMSELSHNGQQRLANRLGQQRCWWTILLAHPVFELLTDLFGSRPVFWRSAKSSIYSLWKQHRRLVSRMVVSYMFIFMHACHAYELMQMHHNWCYWQYVWCLICFRPINQEISTNQSAEVTWAGNLTRFLEQPSCMWKLFDDYLWLFTISYWHTVPTWNTEIMDIPCTIHHVDHVTWQQEYKLPLHIYKSTVMVSGMLGNISGSFV